MVRDYSFDTIDYTNVIDDSANYNAPITGSMIYSNDTINPNVSPYCGYFNGSTYIQVEAAGGDDAFCWTDDGDKRSPSADAGDDLAGAIEFWIKVSGNQPIILWESTYRTFQIFLSSNKFLFRLWDDANNRAINVYSNDISEYFNTWMYVVLRYDGSAVKEGLDISINGEESVSTRTTTGGSGYVGMLDSSSATTLGYTTAPAFFTGYIDDFRVFKNRNITDAEILQRYDKYIPETIAQTVLGITNVDTTLDLDIPELCFIFESYNELSTSDLIVKYGFTSGGTFYSNNFFNVSKDIWLRFELDVDILRSEIDFEFNYDNDTNIDDSEQTLLDITSSIVIPDLFSSSVVNIFYGNNFTSNSTIDWELDFIKAPFEEFSFRHYDGDDTNTNYWNPSEFSCQGEINDSVDKDVTYINVVPDFDSISATLNFYSADPDDAAADIDGLSPTMEIRLYNVDETDGSLTSIAGVYMGLQSGTPELIIYDYYEITSKFPNIRDSYYQKFSSSMTCYLNPTGTKLILTANMGGNVLSRSVNTTGLGSEWVVKILYSFDNQATGDEADITLSITDLDLVSRDLWGFLPDIGDPFGISGIFKTIMTPLLQGFRAIGSFFASALSPLSGAIASALSGFFGLIDSALSLVEEAIDSVGVLIGAVAGSIITLLVAAIAEIFDDILDWVITVIIDLADVLNDLLWLIWDLVVTNTFLNDLITPLGLIWDIILIGIDGLTVILNLALDIITFVTEYAFALYLIATLLIFLSVTNPRDIMSNLGVDITGGSTMLTNRVYVPVGVVWLALTVYWWAVGMAAL